jgi:hypothetical protein
LLPCTSPTLLLVLVGDEFIVLKWELFADLVLQKRLGVAVTPYRDMTKRRPIQFD